MTVDLIRKHRREIMAVAMIWIAIRHSYFPIQSKILGFILNTCGYGGVDIFLFLSSFGLYYAYDKYSNYWSFIKRRFSRVLPYTIPMCIVLFYFNRRTLLEAIIDGLGLSIWFRNDWIYWYTSFLLFMYLLTPLYLRIFKKSNNKAFVTILSIVFVSIICYYLPSYQYIYIFLELISFCWVFILHI